MIKIAKGTIYADNFPIINLNRPFKKRKESLRYDWKKFSTSVRFGINIDTHKDKQLYTYSTYRMNNSVCPSTAIYRKTFQSRKGFEFACFGLAYIKEHLHKDAYVWVQNFKMPIREILRFLTHKKMLTDIVFAEPQAAYLPFSNKIKFTTASAKIISSEGIQEPATKALIDGAKEGLPPNWFDAQLLLGSSLNNFKVDCDLPRREKQRVLVVDFSVGVTASIIAQHLQKRGIEDVAPLSIFNIDRDYMVNNELADRLSFS